MFNVAVRIRAKLSKPADFGYAVWNLSYLCGNVPTLLRQMMSGERSNGHLFSRELSHYQRCLEETMVSGNGLMQNSCTLSRTEHACVWVGLEGQSWKVYEGGGGGFLVREPANTLLMKVYGQEDLSRSTRCGLNAAKIHLRPTRFSFSSILRHWRSHGGFWAVSWSCRNCTVYS